MRAKKTEKLFKGNPVYLVCTTTDTSGWTREIWYEAVKSDNGFRLLNVLESKQCTKAI